MATLNLNKKKFIDEENLKTIVKIGINFGERLNSIESKCIAPYDETHSYLKDELCIYDNYIYKCKSTATGEWNPDRWQLIGDDITELTLDEIKAMLGLTTEQLTTLSNIILDSEVRLDKTYSSSKIYTSIQNAIDTSKAYTLAEIGKASGASYKIASSTSDMTDEKVIYLLQNGSTYDMYIVDSGTPTKIGDTNIDLSGYLKIDEANNIYLKKTDATSTYATKTEANDKVDKTSILSAISSTATDDNLYSAKVINNELDKKFNKDNVLSVIQDTDNTKVFGAKATYDTFNQKADKINLYELKDASGKAKHIIIDLPSSHSISGKTTRLFFTDGILTIGLQVWNGSTLEKDFRVPVISPNHIYIPTKTITPVSSKVNFTNVDSSCSYQVINGMCYVNIWSMNITSNLSVETIFNNLPTAKASAQFVLSNDVGSKTVGMGWIGVGTQNIQCNAQLEAGITKSQGYARFSYPIDESWIPS